jgi:hypothetical protein
MPPEPIVSATRYDPNNAPGEMANATPANRLVVVGEVD